MQVVGRSLDSLKTAPQRMGKPNLPVPYSPVIEETVLTSAKKIEEEILCTMG